jgi:hypothetical protein
VDEALNEAVNHPKMRVKLILLLAISVVAVVYGKRTTIESGVFFGLFALSVLDVAVAVFWL